MNVGLRQLIQYTTNITIITIIIIIITII